LAKKIGLSDAIHRVSTDGIEIGTIMVGNAQNKNLP